MIITEEELQNILIEGKYLDEPKFKELSEYAKNANISFEQVLTEKNIISDNDLGQKLASFVNAPFISLTERFISPEVIGILPERVARRFRVIPFDSTEEGIHLAMEDPRLDDIPSLLEKKVQKKVIRYLATRRDIISTYHVYQRDLQQKINKLLHRARQVSINEAFQDVSIIHIVNFLIDYAYQDRASDIHIEPQETNVLVRFRIDGILHDVLYLPKHLQERVISRIKVMSRLRTDEHFAAQDGKIHMSIDEETIDIRVSIIPIVEGEKIVMRILVSESRQLTLQDLGMREEDMNKITKLFNKSFGMILSTGPTGSGKSTSIYSVLKILNIREKNITTIEDPVEYRIKGMNQIQVNTKTNLTFASGLRSILRQDPNVIFVGEIRDAETAGIAINAALTGHLVFSTLHTNDAPTALPRLNDMGIEAFLIASTVNIIIAQRLVRRVCSGCKKEKTISKEELKTYISDDLIKKYFGSPKECKISGAQGCNKCNQTGYSGRIGLFEVLEVSPSVRDLVVAKESSTKIRKQAIQDGMVPMLEDGIMKIKEGMTSFEEVLRVTKLDVL